MKLRLKQLGRAEHGDPNKQLRDVQRFLKAPHDGTCRGCHRHPKERRRRRPGSLSPAASREELRHPTLHPFSPACPPASPVVPSPRVSTRPPPPPPTPGAGTHAANGGPRDTASPEPHLNMEINATKTHSVDLPRSGSANCAVHGRRESPRATGDHSAAPAGRLHRHPALHTSAPTQSPVWTIASGDGLRDIACPEKLQAIESEPETLTTRRSPRDLGGQDGGTLCAAVPSRAHPDAGAGYIRRATSTAFARQCRLTALALGKRTWPRRQRRPDYAARKTFSTCPVTMFLAGPRTTAALTDRSGCQDASHGPLRGSG